MRLLKARAEEAAAARVEELEVRLEAQLAGLAGRVSTLESAGVLEAAATRDGLAGLAGEMGRLGVGLRVVVDEECGRAVEAAAAAVAAAVDRRVEPVEEELTSRLAAATERTQDQLAAVVAKVEAQAAEAWAAQRQSLQSVGAGLEEELAGAIGRQGASVAAAVAGVKAASGAELRGFAARAQRLEKELQQKVNAGSSSICGVFTSRKLRLFRCARQYCVHDSNILRGLQVAAELVRSRANLVSACNAARDQSEAAHARLHKLAEGSAARAEEAAAESQRVAAGLEAAVEECTSLVMDHCGASRRLVCMWHAAQLKPEP